MLWCVSDVRRKTEDMKKIVVFGNLDLPEGSAGATRCVAFGKLAKSCGYDPIIVGVNYARKRETKGIYNGLKYELIDFDELKFNGKDRGRRKKALKENVLGWLYKNCTKENTSHIILYNVKSELKWLIKYSKEEGIPLIKDVVEWYDKNNFQGIAGWFNYIEDRVGLLYLNKKCENIIAISSLFEQYYKSKKCNVIRIPTILDINEFHNNHCKNNDVIRIVYAGSPMKKDYIINVVKAMLILSETDRRKIAIDFYGVTWEYFLNSGITAEQKKNLDKFITCHGRVSLDEVKVGLSKADYTILLRPNERYANAGFPTKVGESMAMGIPVIANITSDLELYIHDNIEGIICKNETPQSCAEALKKATMINETKRAEMRTCARKQAEKSFYYQAYTQQFKNFLENITGW